MNTEDLKHFIVDIRPKADQSQQPRMVPFGKDKDRLECPWLNWFCRVNKNHISLRGILLMQDWGTVQSDSQDLDEAADDIEKYVKSPPNKIKDKTIKNLLSKPNWAEALRNRSILVSNAVWGLRGEIDVSKKTPRCRYLGAPIHKQAFLTWGKLVVKLATDAAELKKEFRLFVAGGWARFDHQENESGEKLSVYLKRWREWVTAENNAGSVAAAKFLGLQKLDDEIAQCVGSVIFLRHPCIWDIPDTFENDPLVRLPKR